MIEILDNGNLFVEHIYTGGCSDFFKIHKNIRNLSDREIAQILNDVWYGEGNILDYSSKLRDGYKIIQIVDDDCFF